DRHRVLGADRPGGAAGAADRPVAAGRRRGPGGVGAGRRGPVRVGRTRAVDGRARVGGGPTPYHVGPTGAPRNGPVSVGTPDVMSSWFENEIIQPGKLPLAVLFLAFVVTFLFIRFSTRMIRAQVKWWPGNVSGGGLHLHHVVFGIVFMVLAGVGGFSAL